MCLAEHWKQEACVSLGSCVFEWCAKAVCMCTNSTIVFAVCSGAKTVEKSSAYWFGRVFTRKRQCSLENPKIDRAKAKRALSNTAAVDECVYV